MRTLEKWRLSRSEWFSGAVINFAPDEGDGWSSIVDKLFETLDAALFARPDRSFRIGQIKEKLGSLRIYFRVVPEDPELRCTFQKEIEKAQVRSATTCMICGRNGNVSKTPECMLGFYQEQCSSNHPTAEGEC